MKINDVFDGKRFWMVLRNDLVSNWKVRLLTIVLLELIIPVFSLLTNDERLRDTRIYSQLHYLLGILVVAIIGLNFSTRRFFSKTNSSAITVHLLPASLFEKYLSNFFIATICYTLVGTGIVLSGLNLAVWCNSFFLHRILPPLGGTFYAPQFLPNFLVGYLSLQSICFYGGLVFKKAALVKLTALIGIVCFCLNALDKAFCLSAGNTSIDSPLSLAYNLCIPVFFWILTYIRLTESEG